MKPLKASLLALAAVVTIGLIIAAVLIHRGFRATSEPSKSERVIARTVRNFAIPGPARREQNPLKSSAADLQAGRELFPVMLALREWGEVFRQLPRIANI